MPESIHPFDAACAAFRAGRYDEAEAALRRMSTWQPDLAVAYHDLGLALFKKPGCRAEAITALRRAIELKPDFPRALCNLGGMLGDSGHVAESEAMLRRALELDPDSPQTLTNLGSVLSDSGRVAESEAMLRRAIELQPDMAAGYCNLGVLLSKMNRHAEAIATLRRALEIDPDAPQTLTNLGGMLGDSGHIAESEAMLRRAIELRPDMATAYCNLGRLLLKMGRHAEATAMLRRAIELQPDMANAHANLGNALKESGRLDEALASYRRVIELEPSYLQAHSNLIFAMMFAHDDDEAIRREGAKFSAQYETPLLAQPLPPYANDRSRARRLRIGYVSPDFCHHCQELFMTPLLAQHDHRAFEIFCYASVLNPDSRTRRLATFADVWRDVHEFDDERLAQQIREDRIDVLVDLTMHMANGRPLLFARRPAPVQVAYLAYPGTTGSRAIGYRLTDPWLDPPNVPHADERYSERSIRLPDTFWCYDPLNTGIDVNALPAQANGYITFGCLNNPIKVTQWTLRLWSAVLCALPDARFILMAAPGEPRTILQTRFAERGVDPARVSFVSFQPRGDYLRTYWRMDIALDTFPYNGHTTSLDSFWMGVPVITRTGHSAVSRGGLSLLANLQMPELAADNDEDYVKIAVRLASDLPKLAALRAQLRGRMERSPLMDSVRFTRSLEQAYRQMWGEWCAQQEDPTV